MAISPALVGLRIDDVAHRVDARWTMAYSASIDDYLPAYFDTTRADGIAAHPLFVVCPEWAAIVASRNQSLEHGVTGAELQTLIHATHDTTIHRLVRPGDELTTSLQTVGLTQIKPGAKSTTRLTTVDAEGLPVATTTQDGIYLGQTIEGANHPDPAAPPDLTIERVGDPTEIKVAVSAGAAHIYTDCARIWNPIHTDKAVALASGLPDIILHGTANLAHGVSAVVALHCENKPERVRRIVCRFAAMVLLPSTMTVRVWPPTAYGEGHAVAFDVLNAEGAPAVKDGIVLIA